MAHTYEPIFRHRKYSSPNASQTSWTTQQHTLPQGEDALWAGLRTSLSGIDYWVFCGLCCMYRVSGVGHVLGVRWLCGQMKIRSMRRLILRLGFSLFFRGSGASRRMRLNDEKKNSQPGHNECFSSDKKVNCLSAGENTSLYALGICKEEDDMQ